MSNWYKREMTDYKILQDPSQYKGTDYTKNHELMLLSLRLLEKIHPLEIERKLESVVQSYGTIDLSEYKSQLEEVITVFNFIKSIKNESNNIDYLKQFIKAYSEDKDKDRSALTREEIDVLQHAEHQKNWEWVKKESFSDQPNVEHQDNLQEKETLDRPTKLDKLTQKIKEGRDNLVKSCEVEVQLITGQIASCEKRISELKGKGLFNFVKNFFTKLYYEFSRTPHTVTDLKRLKERKDSFNPDNILEITSDQHDNHIREDLNPQDSQTSFAPIRIKKDETKISPSAVNTVSAKIAKATRKDKEIELTPVKKDNPPRNDISNS